MTDTFVSVMNPIPGIMDVLCEQLGQLDADCLSDAIGSIGAHVSIPNFPTPNSQLELPIPNPQFPF